MTFYFGSAKVCSPAMFETRFSFDKDIWIAATDYLDLYIADTALRVSQSLYCSISHGAESISDAIFIPFYKLYIFSLQ